MPGSQKDKQAIIDFLNQILAMELAARDQFFIHAMMYQDWGYTRLYDRVIHEMNDEETHARLVMERILFLGGKPELRQTAALRVGTTVPDMMKNDLALEYEVADHLRKAITYCETAQDFTTSHIFTRLLKDTEEDHTFWLEQQLGHIERLGLQTYLMTSLHH
ncbi:MAG: bacterioferritin [Deltaproteobacteria bacterium]|nr:bacterioferritin [Deltaproteobacteria bacterium]